LREVAHVAGELDEKVAQAVEEVFEIVRGTMRVTYEISVEICVVVVGLSS